jgi:Na+-driven multidrug efflux pump
VFIAFPESIVSLFSKGDMLVIGIGSRALRANGIMFMLFGFQMVFASLFLALGRGKEGGILSIGRQAIFFIPIILILPNLFGIDGVIYAQPAADVLSVILTSVFAVKFLKELKGLKAA